MKKGKLIILAALAAAVLGAAVWHAAARSGPEGLPLVEIAPEDVEKIVLENGDTGARVAVADRGTIEAIVENLSALRFKKGEPVPETDGYRVALTIYQKGRSPYRSFVVDSERKLRYDGYYYEPASGQIGFAFLESLTKSGS